MPTTFWFIVFVPYVSRQSSANEIQGFVVDEHRSNYAPFENRPQSLDPETGGHEMENPILIPIIPITLVKILGKAQEYDG